MAAGLLFIAFRPCLAQDTSESSSPAAAQPQAPGGSYSDAIRETDIPALAGMKIHGEGVGAARREAKPAEGSSAAPDRTQDGGLSYTVRSGDSLGAIAQLYGLDDSDLAHANHLSEDAVLRVGQTLAIPNPFAAQVRRLQAQVQQFTVDAEAAKQRDRADAAKIQTLSDQTEQLRASNQELQHGVKVLPWWRGLAFSAGAAALLMLGVTALTMLEWLMLRRRYRALVEMNEAVRRLDQKYKVALAKAELRLQQLYGRRRVPEEQEISKSPEQIEIDRLNQQLRDLLQEHLERLGLVTEKTRRRNRLRDLIAGVESPVEAPERR